MKMRSLIGAASIAALTRSACTVSATSCARTIAAPFWTASRWAAIEPPMRSSGGDGVTELMKRLREAPTRSGRPKRLELGKPCQADDALFRRLAEADAGVEHDVLACDAGARRDLQRAGKEGDHVGDDVDR